MNRNALRGKERIRYELYDAIKAATKKSTNWGELEIALQRQGIGIVYKFRSGTQEVQGISFDREGIKFKGSAIDRSFSFARLEAQLQRNHQVKQYHMAVECDQNAKAHQIKEQIRMKLHRENPQSPGVANDLLETLLKSELVQDTWDPAGEADKRRRKRKRKHEQTTSSSQGMSR